VSPFIFMKILRRSSLLISAAMLINATTGVAADSSGDVLTQTRDLLSGSIRETKTIDKAPAASADPHQRSNVDFQEQIRQFILGGPEFYHAASRELAIRPKTSVSAVSAWNSRAATDLQEMTRRMILGTESGGKESSSMRLSANEKDKQ